MLLDCCMAIMRRCSDKFRLCLSQEDTYIVWRVGSEVELSSLILKYDVTLIFHQFHLVCLSYIIIIDPTYH